MVSVRFPSHRLQKRWGLDSQEGFPHELLPGIASKVLVEESASQCGAMPTERRPGHTTSVTLERKVFASQRDLGQIEDVPDVPV